MSAISCSHLLSRRYLFAVLSLLTEGIIALAGIGLTSTAEASAPRTPAVTLYQGQGVDANLVNVLPDLVTGNLRFEDSYVTGLGYYHPLETPRGLQWLLDVMHISDTGTGVELIVAKHYGLQHNAEVDAAYSLRFPAISLYALSVRFGAGLGISYALGRPTYEDGSFDEPDKRYRFQSYGAYELEWGLRGLPHVSLATRIHHRSGIYGLIAPRHVGSNFMTLGLRYTF